MSQESPTNQTKLDTSFILAMVAIVISLIGTVTGVYEARVISRQQQIMQEQKSAGVWPYIQRLNYVDYDEESNSVSIIHILENKGIGPAILGDVNYIFDGIECESYSVQKQVKKAYPELGVNGIQNQQVDNAVLSAGERIKVFTIELTPEDPIFKSAYDFNKILNQYQSTFCYCSVYNECWAYTAELLPMPTNNCDKAHQ